MLTRCQFPQPRSTGDRVRASSSGGVDAAEDHPRAPLRDSPSNHPKGDCLSSRLGGTVVVLADPSLTDAEKDSDQIAQLRKEDGPAEGTARPGRSPGLVFDTIVRSGGRDA